MEWKYQIVFSKSNLVEIFILLADVPSIYSRFMFDKSAKLLRSLVFWRNVNFLYL